MNTPDETNIPIKPYTYSQLAAFYEVHVLTIKKWIKKIKEAELQAEKYVKIFNVKQVEIIFNHLGRPYKKQENNLKNNNKN